MSNCSLEFSGSLEVFFSDIQKQNETVSAFMLRLRGLHSRPQQHRLLYAPPEVSQCDQLRPVTSLSVNNSCNPSNGDERRYQS